MLRLLFTFSFLFFAFLSTAQGLGAAQKVELACQHIAPIERTFLARHINFKKYHPNLDHRTVDQYIKSLDGSKLYLLDSDVKKIKKLAKRFIKKVRQSKPDCSDLEKVQEIFVKRVEERVNFAKSFLKKDFKYNKKLKLVLDPDKRKYAASKKELEEFHKKYIQFQMTGKLSAGMEKNESIDVLTRYYDRVLRRTKEISTSDIYGDYIKAFAHSLDPHSSYYTQSEYDDFMIQMSLSLVGIGASLSFKDGFTVIEQLIPGGPAEKSKLLKEKDKIIAVKPAPDKEWIDVVEKPLRDVVGHIRGQKGTKVQLRILRKVESTQDEKTKKMASKPEKKVLKAKDNNQKLEITLVRNQVKLEDQAASVDYIDKKVDGKSYKVALVNLPSFYQSSQGKRSAFKDLRKIFQDIRKKNVDSVVLDLSTNGGGSLPVAVDIAGLFFREGNVVRQSSRFKRGEGVLADDDPRVDYAGPLVILVSRVSASASEIVSGTLKDYKRAIIVGGDHTYGKGSVQGVQDIEGFGAVKTTIGYFYTAGGFSTQHRGVMSDIVFPSPYSTDEIGEKNLDYSLPPDKVKPFLSSEAYVPTGRFAWKLVDKKLVRKLNAKSQKRISNNKDFQKVKKEIEENKKQKDYVILEEYFKKEEKENEETKKEEKATYSERKKIQKEKYLKREDINEAVNIAVDLAVELKKQDDMVIGDKNKVKDNG